jgi:hypothetical protein
MEYIVVVHLAVGELANTVEQRLKAGWRPTGGICAVEEKDSNGPGKHLLFLQAMISGSEAAFLT